MAYADPAKQRAYMRQYQAAWRERKKPEIKVSSAAYYQANRDRLRENQRWVSLERRRGITKEQYLAMWEAQNGKCACCDRRPNGKMPLVVDHCHKTGRIRALLCHTCNPQVERFARYIKKYGVEA